MAGDFASCSTASDAGQKTQLAASSVDGGIVCAHQRPGAKGKLEQTESAIKAGCNRGSMIDGPKEGFQYQNSSAL